MYLAGGGRVNIWSHGTLGADSGIAILATGDTPGADPANDPSIKPKLFVNMHLNGRRVGRVLGNNWIINDGGETTVAVNGIVLHDGATGAVLDGDGDPVKSPNGAFDVSVRPDGATVNDRSTDPWTISTRSTSIIADRDFWKEDFKESRRTSPPPPPVCPEGQIGTPPNCETPPPPVCPEGQIGTPPQLRDPAAAHVPRGTGRHASQLRDPAAAHVPRGTGRHASQLRDPAAAHVPRGTGRHASQLRDPAAAHVPRGTGRHASQLRDPAAAHVPRGQVGTPPNCETPPPPMCPEGQVGTPPNCETPPPPMCPEGQVGTPPNCETPPPPMCPEGQVGTPPNCETPPPPMCPEGQVGTPPNCETPPPPMCPEGQVGTPPNCETPPPPMCPEGQVGTPPNCETPPPPMCPEGQVGTPPNCETPPPPMCPEGQVGTPPNCETPPPPMCPEGQVGTPPNCETPPPPMCPEGQVGTPPNCETPPPPSIIEEYAPRAAVYEALPGFLLRLDAQSFTNERIAWPGSPVWVRLTAGRGSYASERASVGAEFDFDRYAAGAGLVIPLGENAKGSISVRSVGGSADVVSPVGGGTIEAEGYGVALEGSWSGDEDWYARGRFSLTSYDVDLASSALGSLKKGVGARGSVLDIEAGRRMKLKGKTTLTPRAWVTHSAFDVDSFTDTVDARFSLIDASRLAGGLGLVAATERDLDNGLLSLRGSMDLAQTLSGAQTSVDVSGERLYSESTRTHLSMGLGATYRQGRFSVGAEFSAGGVGSGDTLQAGRVTFGMKF